ncbi:hypothetical protein [Actinomadura napierensis]|uniref:ATP-binding protein n=1 Tax=Actinomadura napierensis TaxID=267854 RepID=A0ABN3AH50_9ACTN
MNRSARNLLGLSVAVPLAAALAAGAAPANAADGPVADLVYGTAGQVGPALPPVALPAPVPDTAGRAADLTTGTADGALASAARPGLRTGLSPRLPASRIASPAGTASSARAACRVDAVKAVDGTRVTRLLPRQSMALTPGRDAAPISAPRSGGCLGVTDRSAARSAGFPEPVGEAAKVPGRVVGRVTAVPKRVTGSKVGQVTGAAGALPNGRSAGSGTARSATR